MKLQEVLANCASKAETFDLFVQGSPFEDTRRLIGYQLPGERRVMFSIDRVVRFKVADAKAAMKEAKIDFADQPIVSTLNNAKWQIKKTTKPINLDFIRSRGVDLRAYTQA